MPDDLVARLEGKSSLGRLGLLMHSTAGFVDAGFDGQLTLELSNVANLPITRGEPDQARDWLLVVWGVAQFWAFGNSPRTDARGSFG